MADAAVICLPPALHAAAAIACFERGLAVYLEKPLALDCNEGAAILAAQAAAGRPGMMGFNFRFHPQYQQLWSAIRDGSLGTLVGGRSVFSVAARALPIWKRTRAGGGGALLDLGSHHADLARYLFAEDVVAVSARALSQRAEGDSAFAEFRLASGLIVQSFFSMSAMDEHRFDIYGQKGKFSMERVAQVEAEMTRPAMVNDSIHRLWKSLRALSPKRLLQGPGEPSFRAALQEFVDCLAQDRMPSPGLEDGFRSLRIVEAAERSCLSGREESTV